MDCDGDKESNGNGDKGGWQATAMATKRGMAMAARGMATGNGGEGGWQATAMWAIATRVVGKKR